MGKQYREAMGDYGISATYPEMRELCKRPGKTNEDGSIQYFTEQAHKNECNVNLIIKKYDKTGLIEHVSKFEGTFGDQTGLEFKQAQDMITGAIRLFQMLPADIKKRFKQSPEHLLRFMEDENNRDEAIKLGLIKATWTPDTDGLGEYVPVGTNVDDQDPVVKDPVEDPKE